MIRFNKSDYQIIAIYFLMATCWLLFRFYHEGVAFAEMAIDIPVFWLKIVCSFFLFKFLLERFILQRKLYLLFFVLLLPGLVAIGIVVHLMGLYSEGSLRTESLFPVSNLFIQGFYAVAGDMALFLGLFFSKKYYDQQLENKNLEIENRDHKLKLLRAQFDPHFLFNNLNTIDALIADRPAVAQKYIQKLAQLYRSILDNASEDLVLLRREIEMMENYLFLVGIRFEDDYSFAVAVKQDLDERYLPAGALQVVLENIMKHNEVRDGRAIQAEIVIEKDEISVVNSKGRTVDQASSKSGLTALNNRYRLLTGREIQVTDTAEKFSVILPLVKSGKG